MYAEINKKEWTKALVTAQSKQSTKFNYAIVSRISQITKKGIESIRKSDLAIIDVFYPFLSKEEQNNLREYIKEKFDYVDA